MIENCDLIQVSMKYKKDARDSSYWLAIYYESMYRESKGVVQYK